ncbi:MAG: CHAT domain-containing protein [Okeania sp. SIO3I5]|uniref:CHAT domain-containing protein n=1 Tax=Okeania sp. SIO3I5 TaxID=2607805 RepID=UPI0013BDB32B|nr:CHAT domain-containing protein [Okeania sp. SIO3I5]NEQ36327.1 CHAT domain-containing protein [Okeania sp. SIO3I5]
MKHTIVKSYGISALSIILGTLTVAPANSQPITPASDGTGTTVNQTGNQFDIEGGTSSGGNLFHSFDEFNVNSGQTANFLTTPDISNILGRITGGNASYINGLIQVIGGNSNLFLMNPAGIMFGPNASLNIPASFSVTTATGIGFDNNNYWFEAMGTNNYANLIGEPSGYKFNVSNPGAIVNEANLTLNPGENLTFVGGKVINTGELSTAGGNVTITAVEGGSTLKISQPGHVLSLEVPSAIGSESETAGISPVSLPELLTGASDMSATSINVNESGEVVLTASNTVVEDVAGTAIVSGSVDVSIPLNEAGIGGQINVLGDRVALIDTNINADGLSGGGTVLIGGDSEGTVFNSQQTSVNSGSIISANAIENGDGGKVTIWSDGTTNFAGNINAKGGQFSGDGGFVEVTGKQELTFDGSVDVTAAFGADGTILSQPESVTIGEPENSDSSETVENNTEVETTENSEIADGSETTDSETVENNSEVETTENPEIADGSETTDSETVENNSEVETTENSEIADSSETTETEAPTDPFAQDENADVTISAENIGQLSGNVILEADNDITVNEKIETDSSVELKAGRSININADIDTSVGNGNIDLLGNNDEMNAANRSEGAASINQLDGTTLNAGSGTINIELGNLGEVGDINLANLTTTGQVLVNANGGNIGGVSDSSIINAGSVFFQTNGSGGIGLTNSPLQLNVQNLEAVSGSGGVFFDVGNVNIGGVSENVNGISATGGELEIKSEGNVTLTENISADGAINIEATGDISATGSGISSNGESVSLSATNISIADEFDETSGDADINLSATNDITVEDIEDDVLEFQAGAGAIEFRADADEDGVGVVTMLDNELDTIQTNGRDLTIAGGSIALGNIDTSSYSDVERSGDGGNITLSAQSGDLTTKSLDSSSFEGDGGNIEIEATGDINTVEIIADTGEFVANEDGLISESRGGSGNAGNISIESKEGSINTTDAISARSVSGDGGNIDIIAESDITTEGINSYSHSDESNSGNGGVISLSAGDNIKTGWIYSHSYSELGDSGNGGDISLLAGGDITAKLAYSDSFSELGDSGNGGDISFSAGGDIPAINSLNSFSYSQDGSSGDGGTISLSAEGDITITEVGSVVAPEGSFDSFSYSEKENSGNGGAISINADTIKFIPLENDVTKKLAIRTPSVGTNDSGVGGEVNITTNNFSNLQIVTLSSHSNSGEVRIEGKPQGNLELNDSSIITSKQITIEGRILDRSIQINLDGTPGESGNVFIDNQGDINLKNVSIESDTKSDKPAGNVTITSQGTISLDNSNILSTSNAQGNAGDITIQTPQDIQLTNNSKLQADTQGSGKAGTITVEGRTLNLNQSTSLTTESSGAGAPGQIEIQVNTIDIGEDAKISATITADSTNTEGGGNIKIFANTLNISGTLGIFAETAGVADAGSLILEPYNGSPQLDINFTNNGFISASTTSTGNGGNISIAAPENINIAGEGEIRVTTNNTGNAGIIDIETKNLTTSDGISITASTTGDGDAGAIAINTNTFNLRTGTSLTTETNSAGKAGDISINSETVTIGEGAEISATAKAGSTNTEAGGNISINTNILNIAGDLGIFAETQGNSPAGTLTLQPYNDTPDLDINFSNQGFISARTTSIGNGGNIYISAPESIDIAGKGKITAETIGSGNAGDVNINTGSLTVTNGTQISASSKGTGNAGSVNITAQDSVVFDGLSTDGTQRSGALSVIAPGGQGEAGNVTIETGSLTISNGAFISSDLLGKGKGGSVNITAEDITVDGVSNDLPSEVSSTLRKGAEGEAGNITINTGSLTVTNGGEISASTQGKGNAGSVNITAQDSVVFDGVSLDGTHNSGAFSAVGLTGEGEGGNVTIETGSLTVTNGAKISADIFGKGKGGNINITAEDIVLDGVSNDLSSAVSSTLRTGAEGEAGNVSIETGFLTVTNGAKISTSTEGKGQAGTINITAQDSVVFDGVSLDGTHQSGAFSVVAATGEGEAGGVDINTGSLTVSNGALISADIFGKGKVGSVNITAEDIVLNGGTSDFPTTVSSTLRKGAEGEAGNVTIETGFLTVTNGAKISTSTEGKGNAGTINITADHIVFDGISNNGLSSSVFSLVTPEAVGNAGDIKITAGSLEVTNDAVIDASTRGNGDGGSITIEATERFNLENDGRLAVESRSSGKAGNIEIDSPEVNVGTNSLISATVKSSATNTEKGGNIAIETNNLNISSSSIFAETQVEAPAGTITFKPYNNNSGININFSNGSTISARSTGTGTGGNINITAPETIGFAGDGKFSAETSGTGDAGIVEIQTQNLTIIDEVKISASSKGEGNGGSIEINTNISTLDAETALETEAHSAGKAGNIEINSQELTLNGNSQISATAIEGSTNTEAGGGNISITANTINISSPVGILAETDGETPAGTITFNPYNNNSDININFSNSGNISARSTSTGAGGNINITAPQTVDISGDGKISVETTGAGNAGTIEIQATNLTTTDGIDITASTTGAGNAGNINIITNNFNLEAGTSLTTETNSSGSAGDITINSEILTIGEGAKISATAKENATNTDTAGNITINSNQLNISGELGIFAETQGEAPAGTLTLQPYSRVGEQLGEFDPNLNINFTNSGFISARTTSTGNGGNINISAPQNIDITGEGKISVETTSTGNAGEIDIDAANLRIADKIDITASTTGAGKAGSITIEANQVNIQNDSQILGFTEGAGAGGNITIEATETLNLENNSKLSVETNSAGISGNIEINSPQININENAQISATAKVNATNTEVGGNITINSNELNISSPLGILAETQGAAPAGTVTIAPDRKDGETETTNPNLKINFSNNGFISARSTGSGDGGNIKITAPETVEISGDGKISVETTGAGNAGTIEIETPNLTTTDGIDITASTTGAGNAGNINIITNNFNLEAGTSLTTETNSSGSAGDITINSETLTIGEGAKISATALLNATNTETAGNITINSNQLNISGELGIFAETQGEAPAGTLNLNTYNDNPELKIDFSNSGFISARTTSSGNGGNINLFAPESINITGDGKITVETQGTGNAGIININTQNLTVAEGITISAATANSGEGGSININSRETFQLEGQVLTETTSTGTGGDIVVKTGSLAAENGTISARSTETATGDAGSIEITAQQNITTGIITSSAQNTTAATDGGNIAIASEGGEINATKPIQSFSEQGNAGDVTLNAQTNVTSNIISSHGQQQGGQISITAETGNIDTSNGFLANYSGGGDGGNVTIEATQGNVTTSNIYSFADGKGGQIQVKAGGEINLAENSNIISASEPATNSETDNPGTGGDIILEAGSNINTTTAQIYSGANVGDTGRVEINAGSAIEVGNIELASGFVRDRVTINENFTLIPLPEGEATQGFAGNISIKSNNGTVDTTAGTINSRSPDGSGNISIEGMGDITTGKLEASALNTETPTTGGDISITSEQGKITATQVIETFSKQGTAGSVEIKAADHVEVNLIRSEGTQQGGNITIESRSENSIDAQEQLNTFSTEGIAGNVTLTSPGDITINGIRSEGMEQGGNITVQSGIGSIDATGENIDSYSEEGIGGDVQLNASESINLGNVSSYGMTESGDLIIQSQQAEVNTGNVTTEAPDGSSGSIVINGAQVGTGDLSSIGTTSAGEINVEATDGSINTYDVEIESEGTIGSLTLRATEDIDTGDITQESGEGDANTDISSGGEQGIGDITQTAEGDVTNNQTAEGDITTGDITQTAGDDAINNQNTSVNINTDNATDIQTETGNITTGDITQTADDDAINNQNTSVNINTDNATNIQVSTGNIVTENITQTAGDDAINNQNTGVNATINNTVNVETNTEDVVNNNNINIQVNTGNIANNTITQTAGNDAINTQNTGANATINNTVNIQTNTGDVVNNNNIGLQVNTGNITNETITQTAGNDAINNQNTGVNATINNTANIQTDTGNVANNNITNIQANTGNITNETITQTAGDDAINTQNTGANATINNTANIQANTGDVVNNNITNIQANTGNITNETITQTAGNDTINNQNAGVNATINNTANIQTDTGNVANNNITNIQANTGNIVTENINQTAGNDAINNQNAGVNATINNTANIQTDTGNVANNNITNIQANTGNIVTGNINQTAGNDTINNQNTAVNNTNNDSINIQTNGGQITTNDNTNISVIGGEITTENITQTAGNDATNIQVTFGDITTENITQNGGNNTTNIQTAGGQQNIGNVTQNAGNNTTNIQTAGGQQNLGEINQNFGNESINIQSQEINQNISQVNLNDTTPSNNNQTKNTGTAQEKTEEFINNATDTQQIFKIIDTVNTSTLKIATGSTQVVTILEQNRTNEYSDYFGINLNEQSASTKNVRDILTDMANKTGKESAVIYINSYPEQLQIILYTKSGEPIIKSIPEANRKELMNAVLRFRAQITNPARRFTDTYLPPAQQLYDWLIAPISAELEAAKIDTLLFSMDEGLRALPVAALHDGEQFLIEKYSLSLIPSVSLMDTNYRPLQDTRVLAMGSSLFKELNPLPAVPIELETISQKLWEGTAFINEEFTRNNLLSERENYPYPIIHLATHAEFKPGKANNSYIQLWGSEQLQLDQIRELGWNEPAVELLVLSACRTAVGDKNAELGFAGLAVAAGVKSALASVWYVSDEGTLGLMTEFYTHLNNAKIKAEALRQAQLAMLRGEVVIADGELRGSGARGAVALSQALGKLDNQNLSHPYYWSGFTMVGSPW